MPSLKTRTFFSTLPIDAQCNILRLCSKRPNVDNWFSYFRPCDLLPLIETLPAATLATFRIVSDRVFASCNSCAEPENCSCLSIKSHDTAQIGAAFANPICQQLLRNATRVTLTSAISKTKSDAIVRYCDTLNYLDTRILGRNVSEIQHVLENRGHQLKYLRASFWNQENSILFTKHCTQLQELCMFNHQNRIAQVLPILGPRLQKLKVHSGVCSADIAVIRRHCRALRSLYLRSAQGLHGEHARLLASYRDQLSHANLNSFYVQDVRIVTASCPNVQVEVRVEDPDVLKALGPRATNVTLSFANASPNVIHEALISCTALNTLHIYGFENVAEDVIQVALASPMPRFDTLHQLSICLRTELFEDDLLLLSARTGALRCLLLAIPCCDNAVIDGLRTLVTKNPLLSQVKIRILGLEFDHVEIDDDIEMNNYYEPDAQYGSDFEDGCVDDDSAWFWGGDDALVQPPPKLDTIEPKQEDMKSICDVVRVFHSSNHLRELVIESDPSIEEIWAFLDPVRELLSDCFRRRRLHLKVLDNDYLPVKNQFV